MTLDTNMKNFITILMIAILMCVPFYGCAYDNKVDLVYEGVQGIWFDEPTADKMLKDLVELDILKTKKVPALEVDIQLHKKSVEIYALELKVTEQIAEKYEEAMEKCEVAREKEINSYQKLINKEDKWYKSKTLVFVLGIISGSLLSVGLVFGLNQGAK